MLRTPVTRTANVQAFFAIAQSSIFRTELKELSEEMESFAKIIKYGNNYKKYKRYAENYKASKDPELLNTDKMLADYHAMEAEKESLLAKIHENKEKAERIETLSAELKKFMGKDDREKGR